MMALFDSHCHVDEPKFDDDREDVLTRMTEAGVTRYAVIGSDMATSRHSADFAAAHPGCYAAIGIHPHEAKGFVKDDLQRLADWSKEEKVVAIGEIGLDYYYDLSAARNADDGLRGADGVGVGIVAARGVPHPRCASGHAGHHEAPQEAFDRRHHPLLFRQLGDCEGVPELGYFISFAGL